MHIIMFLIVLAVHLGVLGLVWYLGGLLIGLIPDDAMAQRIVGTIWIVICVLVAILILLGAVGGLSVSMDHNLLLQ